MIVCQHCGDKGFEEALTLCKECGLYALYRYCLEVLPEDLSEDMIWFCEDCGPNISKQCTCGKTNSPSSGLSVSVEVESPKKCRSGFKKNEKVVTASEAKTEVQTDEREPSGYEPRCREKCDENQMLRRKRRFVLEDEKDQCLKTSLVAVSNDKASNVVEQRVTTGSEVKTEGQMCGDGSFSNGSQLREKCDKEQKLGRKMRLDLEDEEAKPSETSQVSICPPKPANTFEQTVAKAVVQLCDVRSSSNKSQCVDESDKGQQLKIRQKTSQCSDPKPSNVLQHKVNAGSVEKRKLHLRDGGPSGNMPTSKETCDYDQKPTEKRKLVLSDEEAEPVKITQVLTKEKDEDVEVNLPLGTSLLQNKKLGVQIMRQLLTDVDMDAVNEGRIQRHLDDFLWDGLKCILRGMGLIYRSTDKDVEQRERIKELEEIDKERGERLLDIGRRFRDVKASTDGLIAELHSLNQTAKEGAEMMKAMVDKFDKAKAENEALKETVKQRDADISGLVARVVSEYERATLKARYELLKEYKQGLLVDIDVDEEIELFEDPLLKPETQSPPPV